MSNLRSEAGGWCVQTTTTRFTNKLDSLAKKPSLEFLHRQLTRTLADTPTG